MALSYSEHKRKNIFQTVFHISRVRKHLYNRVYDRTIIYKVLPLTALSDEKLQVRFRKLLWSLILNITRAQQIHWSVHL